ncbi:MAG TPA: lipid II flippase MurJ, partial [Rhodothermales bacterium]
PLLVSVFTPGFEGARRELMIDVVRIFFPMTGVLVLSAWALGILNSHRRFFVPYVAPVLWNVAIMAGLFVAARWVLDGSSETFSTADLNGLVLAGCVGALVGALLQFLVQLPLVVQVMREFRFSFSTKAPGVKEALRAFGPVVAGRGVYQLSAYLDLFLASFLIEGALGALRYSQMLYMLPVSLFGLSVAASELPELSRMRADAAAELNARINQSMRQMLYLVVPTVFGYLAFGYLAVGALYETGSFGEQAIWLVYLVLGAYSIGLIATTASRLLQNTYYALRDTKTPARIAAIRVLVSAVVAVPAMLLLDDVSIGVVPGVSTGTDPLFLGAAGLALGSTAGAWIELVALGRTLRSRLGRFPFPTVRVLRMFGIALIAAVPAALVWYILPPWHVAIVACVVIGLYGAMYIAIGYVAGFTELQFWTGRFIRR